MTKRNHIDLILDWLSGGDAPTDIKGKYHPEIISKHIEVVYNDLLYQFTREKYLGGDFSFLDDYTKTYPTVTVSFDEDRNEYYCVLPAKIVQLPKARGIRKICPRQDQAYSFIYVANNSTDIYSELETGIVADKPHFYLEGSKTYFWEQMTPEIQEAGLMFKLVVPFDEFDDDDEVTVPGGKDGLIFDMVVARMSKKPNEDTYNDTNSDKKV